MRLSAPRQRQLGRVVLSFVYLFERDVFFFFFYISSYDIFPTKTNFFRFSQTKYIATVEGGMVIVGASEEDGGRYDCLLAGELLCTFNLTVDAHRCSPPARSQDYHRVYSDWCHEFQKYKSAMKSWEKKQAVSVVVCALRVLRFPPSSVFDFFEK